MNVTRSQFKQIVKEEILRFLSNYDFSDLLEAHDPEALEKLGVLRRKRPSPTRPPSTSPGPPSPTGDPLEQLLRLKKTKLKEKYETCEVQGTGRCQSFAIALWIITVLQKVHKAYGGHPPIELHDLINATLSMNSKEVSSSSRELLDATPQEIRDKVSINIDALESWISQLSKKANY